MEPMSWEEIFDISNTKGLRDYREENKIITPEEYNISVRRVAVALAVYAGITLFFVGLAIGIWLI